MTVRCATCASFSLQRVNGGERVFDRLREDGGEAIPFDWASWRGRVAA